MVNIVLQNVVIYVIMQQKNPKGGIKMIQEGKLRVTPESIISQILEGHKTFADLAPKYGMTEEELKRVVSKIVNDKDYPRLLKASNKYIVARSRVGNKKISCKEKVEKQKEIGASRQEMATELSSIEKKITKNKTEKEQTEKKVEQVEIELKELKKQLERLNKDREKLDQNKEKLIIQIKEIDSKNIFLVAPNYKGKLPCFGTMISVVQMEGVQLDDLSDVVLTSEMSAEDIFLFNDMEEAKEVRNFIKLVTKYFVDDIKYKLLVDDEKVIILLKKQGLIDEENET